MSISVVGQGRVLATLARLATAGEVATVAIKAQGVPAVEAELRARAPVATGALRDSIGVQEEDALSVGVGAGIDYDKYVQLGTRYMRAQPYAEGVAEEVGGEVLGVVERAVGLLL